MAVGVGVLCLAAAGLSIILSAAAAGRSARAQALPAVSAALAAPGAAPACLPPGTDTTFIPAAPGPTGVLLRGSGFQPGERVLFGLISVTPAPPTTKVIFHDVQPIVEAIVDGSGSLACEAYLDLHFINAPSYYQIGAFSQSTVAFEGTELLPAAVLFIPGMPPAGSGGRADPSRAGTVARTAVSSFALLAFAVAGLWPAASDERRDETGYGG